MGRRSRRGLAHLTRPDLAAVGAVAVLVAGRSWWRTAAAATAVAAHWFIASWWWLGSAVPDSALLKVAQPWGYWTFTTGYELWFGFFPYAVVLSVTPAVVGLLALPWWLASRRRWRVGVLWGLGAAAHAVLFIAMDTAPYHWYYAPTLGSLGLVAVATAAALPHRLGTVTTAAATAAISVSLVAMWNDGVPRDRAPIASNWASAQQFEAVAEQLPVGSTVRGAGEIGTLAYYCNCRVLDGFGDRGYIGPLLEQRRATAGPLTQQLLDLNYRHFVRTEPQRLDYNLDMPSVPTSPGVPMVGSWGDARTVIVTPTR